MRNCNVSRHVVACCVMPNLLPAVTHGRAYFESSTSIVATEDKSHQPLLTTTSYLIGEERIPRDTHSVDIRLTITSAALWSAISLCTRLYVQDFDYPRFAL